MYSIIEFYRINWFLPHFFLHYRYYQMNNKKSDGELYLVPSIPVSVSSVLVLVSVDIGESYFCLFGPWSRRFLAQLIVIASWLKVSPRVSLHGLSTAAAKDDVSPRLARSLPVVKRYTALVILLFSTSPWQNNPIWLWDLSSMEASLNDNFRYKKLNRWSGGGERGGQIR